MITEIVLWHSPVAGVCVRIGRKNGKRRAYVTRIEIACTLSDKVFAGALGTAKKAAWCVRPFVGGYVGWVAERIGANDATMPVNSQALMATLHKLDE